MTFEVKTRAGSLFEIRPATTALIMIDFQNAFMHDKSNLAARGYDMAPAKQAASVAKDALHLARDNQMTVVHTREAYLPDMSDVNPVRARRGTVGTLGPLGRHLIRGEESHAIVDYMAPIDAEAVVDKAGFDGFFRSTLEESLKGMETVVICGLTTECCVFSTIRSSVERGLRVLTLVDACAGITDTAHELTISLLEQPQLQFGSTANFQDFSAAF